MGLDGVELVMAVEEEFDIVLGLEEASSAETFGQLLEIVIQKARLTSDNTCPSMRGFYKVRKKLMDAFSIDRNRIHPDTPLNEYFPEKSPKDYWPELLTIFDQDSNNIPLLRPPWLNKVIKFTAIASFLISLLWLVFHIDFYAFPAALFISAAVTIVILEVTKKHRTLIPQEFYLTKDLIRFVATLSPQKWEPNEVEEKLRDVVCYTLNVPRESVHYETHFVNDLGIG